MKALCRTIAFFCAVAAFVVLVIDGTTAIAANAAGFTSVGDALARFGDGGALARWQSRLSQALHPAVWTMLSRTILPLPAMLVMLVLAMAFWRLGRRNPPPLALRGRR